MAYEVFDQKVARVGSAAVTITADGRLALNADAGDLFRKLGSKFVHLLWDAEARKIALRPVAKADSRSYKVSIPNAHKRGMMVSASAFLRYIGWPLSKRVTLPAKWNEKESILEAVLPAVGSSTRSGSESRNEASRGAQEAKR